MTNTTQEQARLTLAEVEQIIKIHEGENCFVVQFGEALLASQTALDEAIDTLEKVYPEHDVEHLRAALLKKGDGDGA